MVLRRGKGGEGEGKGEGDSKGFKDAAADLAKEERSTMWVGRGKYGNNFAAYAVAW